MKVLSLAQLQKELKGRPVSELEKICLRLARHKKENKELLQYLLVFSENEEAYRAEILQDLEEQFAGMNRQSAYTIKKGLQKAVRMMNRYLKYTDDEVTRMEVRLWFCDRMKESGIRLSASPVIGNMYEREKKKIAAMHGKMHEDLQFDYRERLERHGIQE